MIFVFLFYARALQTTDGAQADDVTFCHVVLYSGVSAVQSTETPKKRSTEASLLSKQTGLQMLRRPPVFLATAGKTKPRDRR